MKISKQVMNASRVNQLKILAEFDDEMNLNALANKSDTKLPKVKSSVQRFRELGLVVNTGGGFFAISDKGRAYVLELAKQEAETKGDSSFQPDYAVPPAETMIEVLKDKGLTLEQVSEQTHIPLDLLEEVSKANAPIDTSVADALQQMTGINHRFWLKLESNYQETLYRLKGNDMRNQ